MGNLSLPAIAPGQKAMYQTSNDADNALDLAMTDALPLDLSGGNVSLTAGQFTRAIAFQTSGNSVSRTLTVPASKRLFIVINGGTATLTVARGTGTGSVPAADSAVFYTDGTTNGINTVVASVAASGTAGGDLTGTYPDPTIAAAAVSFAKMANLAANSVIGNTTGSSAVPEAVAIGSANGIASLDSGGKVPIAQLPAAVAGAMSYQGTWNATTNSPTITSSTGTQGYFYKVATAGTTTIDGHSHWNVGDLIVFDGTVWDKIDGLESEVISVAGKTGVVTLVVADVSGAAPLISPDFTGGTPLVPTATPGTNTTQAASTGFVAAAVAALSGGLVYKGTWNATTNSPTITSSTGTLGWFYKVATAGTTTIDGISVWNVGDLLIFDGSTWDRIDGSQIGGNSFSDLSGGTNNSAIMGVGGSGSMSFINGAMWIVSGGGGGSFFHTHNTGAGDRDVYLPPGDASLLGYAGAGGSYATTVSALPSASANQDQWAVVTDATLPTYGGALTGGGSVRCPVWSDGTSWTSR